MRSDGDEVLRKVRQALGRENAPPPLPSPPELPDALLRMVGRETDLAESFIKAANEQKMIISRRGEGDVVTSLLEFLREREIKRMALPVSPLLERLGIFEAIRRAGVEAKRWDAMSLDELYDFDCAVTDVQAAVAENATLVIKPSARHGRALSLVPMFHVAIVEPAQIIPDLIDLFEQMRNDADRSNVILITGPSKTADIEMNVVTGVHGPNVVNVFLLA